MIPLTWSNWIDLDADLATYRQHVSATAGFYRISSHHDTTGAGGASKSWLRWLVHDRS